MSVFSFVNWVRCHFSFKNAGHQLYLLFFIPTVDPQSIDCLHVSKIKLCQVGVIHMTMWMTRSLKNLNRNAQIALSCRPSSRMSRCGSLSLMSSDCIVLLIHIVLFHFIEYYDLQISCKTGAQNSPFYWSYTSITLLKLNEPQLRNIICV